MAIGHWFEGHKISRVARNLEVLDFLLQVTHQKRTDFGAIVNANIDIKMKNVK
jgi:hypothetical protein